MLLAAGGLWTRLAPSAQSEMFTGAFAPANWAQTSIGTNNGVFGFTGSGSETGLTRTPKLNFCVGGVRPSPGAATGFIQATEHFSTACPFHVAAAGTAALRHGIVRTATTGNFGVRD